MLDSTLECKTFSFFYAKNLKHLDSGIGQLVHLSLSGPKVAISFDFSFMNENTELLTKFKFTIDYRYLLCS